jgi:nicotinamide mononucleotide transporter
MSFHEIFQQFIEGMKVTTWPEYVAVFAGIASVWYSRKENILVYPVGLINTIIYVWLSVKGQLLGEGQCEFLLYRDEHLRLDTLDKERRNKAPGCSYYIF